MLKLRLHQELIRHRKRVFFKGASVIVTADGNWMILHQKGRKELFIRDLTILSTYLPDRTNSTYQVRLVPIQFACQRLQLVPWSKK